MSALVLHASIFAEAAHAAVGQVRKYTGDPYIVHPRAVAGMVRVTAGATDHMVAAALLHDVVEDTKVPLALIDQRFGEVVGGMVEALTDYYTPKNFPHMNRELRKGLEVERMSYQTNDVKTIKLADLIDNTASIGGHDPKFMKVYGPEKRQMLAVLVGGDADLWDKADEVLKGYGY